MSSLPFFLSGLWQERQLALKMGWMSFSKLTGGLSCSPSLALAKEGAEAGSAKHNKVIITGADRIGLLLAPFSSDYYTTNLSEWRLQARTSRSTRPWTSVSRRSRPPKRKVRASWSRPSRWSTVAQRSYIVQG